MEKQKLMDEKLPKDSEAYEVMMKESVLENLEQQKRIQEKDIMRYKGYLKKTYGTEKYVELKEKLEMDIKQTEILAKKKKDVERHIKMMESKVDKERQKHAGLESKNNGIVRFLRILIFNISY